MEKKSRLGRGLDALLSGEGSSTATAGTQTQVSLEVIEQNPYQPRKTFDSDELAALSASIRTHGVLQPLVVRQVGERYQLVAGERRLRAAREAGLNSVPVTVVDFNDQQTLEAALVENIQRSDLNPIEKAQGFKDYLTRYHMTHEQLAARLGLGRATITNLVALLELPAELQDAVRVGQLSTGHAKILKGISDPARQIAVSKEIIARGLSVHATEAFLKQLASEEKAQSDNEGGDLGKERTPPEKTTHVQGIENELRQKLSLRVEIRVKSKDKGQIVLSFESNDDFERVVEVLRRSA
ncbi:MAG TPA: ParB/RepB/Spo0J family partition protein [Gemmataceae bacterium]|nr:ParB/RepB/Spo0J family partition protein [Gemmataceae bacterium]